MVKFNKLSINSYVQSRDNIFDFISHAVDDLNKTDDINRNALLQECYHYISSDLDNVRDVIAAEKEFLSGLQNNGVNADDASTVDNLLIQCDILRLKCNLVSIDINADIEGNSVTVDKLRIRFQEASSLDEQVMFLDSERSDLSQSLNSEREVGLRDQDSGISDGSVGFGNYYDTLGDSVDNKGFADRDTELESDRSSELSNESELTPVNAADTELESDRSSELSSNDDLAQDLDDKSEYFNVDPFNLGEIPVDGKSEHNARVQAWIDKIGTGDNARSVSSDSSKNAGSSVARPSGGFVKRGFASKAYSKDVDKGRVI